mmetsp:Transcript_7769/g.22851  ORF Transcript_7769/g.22851 Transcript_7769/m.22851 type:complete len:253 (-) Transcript_7769:2318-3076(-)
MVLRGKPVSGSIVVRQRYLTLSIRGGSSLLQSMRPDDFLDADTVSSSSASPSTFRAFLLHVDTASEALSSISQSFSVLCRSYAEASLSQSASKSCRSVSMPRDLRKRTSEYERGDSNRSGTSSPFAFICHAAFNHLATTASAASSDGIIFEVPGSLARNLWYRLVRSRPSCARSFEIDVAPQEVRKRASRLERDTEGSSSPSLNRQADGASGGLVDTRSAAARPLVRASLPAGGSGAGLGASEVPPGGSRFV